MSEQTNSIFGDSGVIDLGSGAPADFDPFDDAPEEEPQTAATPAQLPEPAAAVVQQPEPGSEEENGQGEAKPSASPPDPPIDNPLAQAIASADVKAVEATKGNLFSRAPKFVYANAEEDIADAGKTFEELRLDKATDFPELEDGKRVSWSVEYGKVNKAVSDPKGTTVAKMKTQIEQSKEFLESLKKMKIEDRDKVICKVKPRITAQSKGENAYRGIFQTYEDAVASGKVISIFPARDGAVYEQRQNEIGTFITPTSYVPELSEVSAGFIPALPRIPIHLLRMVIGFFRSLMRHGKQFEALVHIIWVKESKTYSIHVPKQSVTKVSVNAELEQNYDPARHIHVMDIHSHNSMPARFSVTDDADEKATRLYAVIGRLDQFLPEMCVRISNGGKYLTIKPELVFEGFDADYPDLWPDSVTVPDRLATPFPGTVRLQNGEEL